MIDLKLKTLISNTVSGFGQEGVVEDQVRWKFLKYEIKKQSKKFFKTIFALC